MYLTQSDLTKLQLQNNNNFNLSEILKEVIKEDLASDAKKNMKNGVDYYQYKNLIKDFDFQKFIVDGVAQYDLNASNNRIINGFQKILVDQKVGYIAGNEIKISGTNDEENSDEKLSEALTNLLGKNFYKLTRKWLTGTSNKGREYVHPYINRNGEFKTVIIPAEEIIPVYDSTFQEELVAVIRYYPVIEQKTPSSPKVIKYKVEIWNEEMVYFFYEEEKEKFIPDPAITVNPQYHFYVYNTIAPNEKFGKSWGKVPFVELKNNDECYPDIVGTKDLIDAYDFNLSKFSNDLADIAQAIWVLKDYGGTSLSEFIVNLRQKKSISVKGTGNAEPKTLEIPNEGYNSLYDRIEDNIFVFGMGVNPKTDKFGNSPSGIALKFMYAGLDIKSDIVVTEMKLALHELYWFAATYLNLKNIMTIGNIDEALQEIESVFSKALLINEAEQVEMAKNSKGTISDETIIEHHPWVTDSKKELERIKAEREQNSIDVSDLEEVEEEQND